jgi:hypothetical protein
VSLEDAGGVAALAASSSPTPIPSVPPFTLVQRYYKHPAYIAPHPLQIETVNELAPIFGNGEWLDMGTGKTFVATWCALWLKLVYGMPCVCIMPPLLIRQWSKWLKSIRTHHDPETPALSVTEYRATAKQVGGMKLSPEQVRAAIDLDNDFILVGIQIFRKEFYRIREHFGDRPFLIICDEAMFLAKIESLIHELVYDMAVGRPTILLTGTLGMPQHAYGLMKFTNPGAYRNWKHFENMHILEYDHFGTTPTIYQNLDLLGDNLAKNTKRILYEDMYPDAEIPFYDVFDYDLDDKHYKLYEKLAEEQILALPDGGKIDGSTEQRLRHMLGQIIVNYPHFSGNPKDVSTAVKLIQGRLEALGDGKLVVFCNYRLSVNAICDAIPGALPINGDVTQAQKDRNIDSFINDSKSRLMVVQFISGSKGLDGLQHVCHTAMFIEPCTVPDTFHQAVARLKRTGQTKRVHVLIPIANRTLQRRGFNRLLKNDAISNQVARNSVELRKIIYGSE